MNKKIKRILKAFVLIVLFTGVFFQGLNMMMNKDFTVRAESWYAGYSYRNRITISSSYVDEDMYDYPVYFVMSINPELLKEDGSDILFTQNYSGATYELDYELILYDDEAHSLKCWVELKYIDKDADTDFYIYYGNIFASSRENIEGTWNSGYKAVWHFKEETGTYYDSTVYGNDGTLTDADSDTIRGVSTACGHGVNLNGDMDYISGAYNSSIDIEEKTYILLIKPDVVSINWVRIFTKDSRGSYDSGITFYSSDILYDEDTTAPSYNGNSSISTGAYTLVTVSCPTTESNVNMFYNRMKQNLSSVSDNIGTVSSPTGFTIGARQTHAANFYNGVIDEFFILNRTVSYEYVNTTYNCLLRPTVFLICQELESLPNPPFNFEVTAITQTDIHLTWEKGSGTENTVIYGMVDEYPTFAEAGSFLAYNGTDESFTVQHLSHSTRYYFCAWSWDNESNEYSGAYDRQHDTTFFPIVVIQITDEINCSIDYDDEYWQFGDYMFYYINISGTGNTTSINLFENGLNVNGTHEYALNASGYSVWANYTGNYTDITLFEDIGNASGTHEYAIHVNTTNSTVDYADAYNTTLFGEMIDNNWNTFITIANYGQVTYYSNFTVPAGATTASWEIKDLVSRTNISLPSAAFAGSYVWTAMTFSSLNMVYMVYYSGEFHVVLQRTEYAGDDFYEDSMHFTVLVGGSSEYYVWANYTSYLLSRETIVDATGTHESRWNSTTGTWMSWANYTGNAGSTFMSTNLSVINPNPGNGTHSTNYLRRNTSGLTTSVDVSYNNFTTPPALLPGGVYSMEFDSLHYNGPTLQNNSGVYTTVNANHSGQVISGHNWVGQLESGGDFCIERSYLIFNTTLLPDEAIVDSAYITMVIFDDESDVDFNVSLQRIRSPSPHNPMDPRDYYRNAFLGEYNTRNTTGYADEDWFNFSLPAAAFTDIDATWHTYFGLRSDQDIVQSPPAAGTNEWIGFYGPGGVQPWKAPHLIINYTIPSSNWHHIVNLTFWSNSSGAWMVYDSCHVVENSTVTVSNINFSGNMSYWWNVSWESNHSSCGDSPYWWFETVPVSGSGGVVLVGGRSLSSGSILGGFFTLCLVIPVAFIFIFIFIRRRRQGNG